jgi:hypothetical protein
MYCMMNDTLLLALLLFGYVLCLKGIKYVKMRQMSNIKKVIKRIPSQTPSFSEYIIVNVEPFRYKNIKYYKSQDNIVYDKSGFPQGEWNEKQNMMILYEFVYEDFHII